MNYQNAETREMPVMKVNPEPVRETMQFLAAREHGAHEETMKALIEISNHLFGSDAPKPNISDVNPECLADAVRKNSQYASDILDMVLCIKERLI